MENEIAKNLVDKVVAQSNEVEKQYQDMFAILNTDTFQESELKEIASLLMLDDEKFALIAPGIIENLMEENSKPENKIKMAQVFNANGITVEDFKEQTEALIENIQKEMEGFFSQTKIDFVKELLIMNYNAVADTQGLASRTIKVPAAITREGAKMPCYAHLGDAGADIYSPLEVEVKPGETVIINTGIKLQIPKGYQVEIRPRSGLSAKTKLRVANAPGTIDSNYTSEIGVIITNTENLIRGIDTEYNENGEMIVKSIEFGRPYTIEKGERIAQMVLMPAPVMDFIEVDDVLENQFRGEGAYGSSGKF